MLSFERRTAAERNASHEISLACAASGCLPVQGRSLISSDHRNIISHNQSTACTVVHMIGEARKCVRTACRDCLVVCDLSARIDSAQLPPDDAMDEAVFGGGEKLP